MIERRRKPAAGRGFAPARQDCQRAKCGPVATKALDLRGACRRPWNMPDSAVLDMDLGDPRLYREDSWRPHFARLRREDPVHFHPDSPYGPYWSVTRYADIMKVELDHGTYSSASELGGIQIADQPLGG